MKNQVFHIIIVLFLCVGIKAQSDWNTAYQLAEKLSSENEMDLALVNANKALSLAKINYGNRSLEYGLSLQQIALIKFDQDNSEEAIIKLKESITTFSQLEGEQQNQAISTYLLGSIYLAGEQFALAENYLLQSLEIIEKSDGASNEYYPLVLEELGLLYFNQCSYESALEVYKGLQEALLLKNGKNSLDLIPVYNQIAEIYYETNYFQSAENYLYQAIELCENNGLLSDVLYFKSLALLSFCYIETSNLGYAETLLSSSKKYYSTHDLTSDPFYQKILIALGEANLKLEYLGEAHSYLTLAIELHKKYNWSDKLNVKALFSLSLTLINSGNYSDAEVVLGNLIKLNEVNKKYSAQEICNLKGVFEYKKGDIPTAQIWFKKALDLEKEYTNPLYFNCLNNYANTLSDLGQFDLAETTYISILEKIETKFGTQNQNYLSALNNLALLYMEKGDFAQTEIILTECLKLSKSKFGPKSNQYALALNNIGTMYYEMGNYEVAVDYFIEADALYLENFGEESVEYCSLQNNIALLFSSVDNHDEAIARLSLVKAIELKILGNENLSFIQTLNNLSSEYLVSKNYDLCQSTINEAISLHLKHFGSSTSTLATSYSILGNLFLQKGLKKESLAYLQKSNAIFLAIYGSKNRDYAKSLIKLAGVEFESKMQILAWKHFKEGQEILNTNLNDNFSFLSEQEKERYLKTLNQEIDLFFQYGMDYSITSPEIGGDLFNQSLYIKGLLLKSTSVMRNTILNGNNDSLKNLYNDWISLKKRIADIYSAQYITNSGQLAEMESKANQMEKALFQSIQLNPNFTTEISSDWKQIQNKITSKDLVLEFISYFSEAEQEVVYAVLIVSDTCKFPKAVKLFKESQIKEILGNYGANNFEYITEIYGNKNKHNTSLYNLIWKPIEKELINKKNIYISPTGVLHRISLWALGEDPTKLMIDMYNLQSMSSSNNLLHPKSIYKEDIKKVALFGGIAYNSEKTEEEHWKYLDGTSVEVSVLNKSFNNRKVQTEVITGLQATETKFKECSSSSELIHVATHGFFFPDPEKLTAEILVEDIGDVDFRGGANVLGLTSFTHNKNPLMRSGLIFAGVNDLWNKNKYVSQDDGVLTALEVTQMDFRKTKIVVLSACETGLGEIDGNEGVYGLQRALKMHGVPYIINSLWQVPDKETQEFMVLFYENILANNNEVKVAFNNARNAMRAKYDPYYWAAFVLIE